MNVKPNMATILYRFIIYMIHKIGFLCSLLSLNVVDKRFQTGPESPYHTNNRNQDNKNMHRKQKWLLLDDSTVVPVRLGVVLEAVSSLSGGPEKAARHDQADDGDSAHWPETSKVYKPRNRSARNRYNAKHNNGTPRIHPPELLLLALRKQGVHATVKRIQKDGNSNTCIDDSANGSNSPIGVILLSNDRIRSQE